MMSSLSICQAPILQLGECVVQEGLEQQLLDCQSHHIWMKIYLDIFIQTKHPYA